MKKRTLRLSSVYQAVILILMYLPIAVVVAYSFNASKKAIKTIPKMISGTMIGKVDKYSMVPLLRKETLAIPTAPRVPMIPAAPLLRAASTRLFFSASKSPRFPAIFLYQSRVRPPQTVVFFDALKE